METQELLKWFDNTVRQRGKRVIRKDPEKPEPWDLWWLCCALAIKVRELKADRDELKVKYAIVIKEFASLTDQLEEKEVAQ